MAQELQRMHERDQASVCAMCHMQAVHPGYQVLGLVLRMLKLPADESI
eukprot:gene6124-1041_t